MEPDGRRPGGGDAARIFGAGFLIGLAIAGWLAWRWLQGQ